MRPYGDPLVTRKELRRAAKGEARGRRSTHPTTANPPRRGGTWLRRHQWMPGALDVYLTATRPTWRTDQ